MKKILKMVLRYFLFIFMYFLGYYLFRILNKIKIIGKENLVNEVNTLFIGKHDTYIDSWMLKIFLISTCHLFFRQRLIPYDAADKNNFFATKFDSILMNLLKVISVDRQNMNELMAEKLIKNYCSILSKENLILYPEGGRTKIGKNPLDDFKTGVAKTILIMTLRENNFKVIPFYFDDVMNEIMPRDIEQNYLKIKRGKKGYVIFGKPINFLDICIDERNSYEEKLELIKNRARNEIISLAQKIPCE